MTQNYGPPGGYPASYSMGPVTRPTIVTVLSIIGIIWAAFGVLCCNPVLISPYLIDLNAFAMQTSDPAMQANMEKAALLSSDGVVRTSKIAGFGLSFVTALLLFVGSILSLRLKPVGRMLMNFYALASIFVTVAFLVLEFAIVGPRIQILIDEAGLSPETKFEVIGQTAFLSLIALVVPLLVLIFFNIRKVKDAFAGRNSQSPMGGGYGYAPPSSMPPPPPPPVNS